MVTRNSPAARIALATSVVLAFALVPTALAGRGHAGGNATSSGSSMSFALYTDQNGNGLLNWGDAVAFSATTSMTTSPSAKLTCSQGGVPVLWGQGSFYLGNVVFPLQSGAWTGGAADCTATLFYLNGDKAVTLATSNFHVDA